MYVLDNPIFQKKVYVELFWIENKNRNKFKSKYTILGSLFHKISNNLIIFRRHFVHTVCYEQKHRGSGWETYMYYAWHTRFLDYSWHITGDAFIILRSMCEQIEYWIQFDQLQNRFQKFRTEHPRRLQCNGERNGKHAFYIGQLMNISLNGINVLVLCAHSVKNKMRQELAYFSANLQFLKKFEPQLFSIFDTYSRYLYFSSNNQSHHSLSSPISQWFPSYPNQDQYC